METIARIRQNHNDAWLPSIGFGAEATRDWLGGTAASDINADIGTLKSGGALTDILKMTQETGKNPFTPMSNSDVDLIARNKGNLDQAQSPKNFFANLGNYERAYTNAYGGAVGKRVLSQEIERLLPTVPVAKRDEFKANALKLYNQRMAAKGGFMGGARRKATAKPSSGGSWGKVEVSD